MTESIPVASGSIFISYRRQETAFAAGWLFDRLVAHFGKDQVFKDVDSIQLGDDFADVISAAVGNCDVLLALIGDRWLTITGEDGQRRRLDDLHDFVRLEIETALIRDIRVIPVIIFRKHPAVLMVPIFIILCAVTVASSPVNTIRPQNRNGLEITWILLALFLAWALWRIIAWIRNYFVITSRRMLLVSGILRLRAETISFAKVTDISYRKPMLGRVLGYGEIIFERAGTSADLRTVYQIPYPEQTFLELTRLIFPNIDDPSGS